MPFKTSLRCIECGCFTRTIGYVPPITLECRTCGEVFRATEENKIKEKVRVDREKLDTSRDKYPSYMEPNWKKLKGER